MQNNRFMTRTLRTHPHGGEVASIIEAAISAVDPATAIHAHVQRTDNIIAFDDLRLDAASYDHIYIVGAGKAADPMAKALAEIVSEYLTGGIVVTKYGHRASSPSPLTPFPITVLESGHPIPDDQSVKAAQSIVDLMAKTTQRDLVLIVISGGGSSLMTLPVAGITLAELQHMTDLLLASGATINEINTLRKHIDAVKGGGLLRSSHSATVVALILSDVIANPLDIIASGPATPDPTTFTDAYNVLVRYQLLAAAPSSIIKHLEDGMNGRYPENLQADDPALATVRHIIIGDNRQAAMAAQNIADAYGYHTMLLTTQMQGEARECGIFLSSILREEASAQNPLAAPALIIAGGETTVTLRGKGKGGRNQELALSAARQLAGVPNVMLAALATDGGDGQSPAAGAIVTGDSYASAIAQGLNLDAFLRNNDSYTFFSALDDALMIGPTRTNVNDLVLLFAWQPI